MIYLGYLVVRNREQLKKNARNFPTAVHVHSTGRDLIILIRIEDALRLVSTQENSPLDRTAWTGKFPLSVSSQAELMAFKQRKLSYPSQSRGELSWVETSLYAFLSRQRKCIYVYLQHTFSHFYRPKYVVGFWDWGRRPGCIVTWKSSS